jgi:DNA-binding XRE family transcriptional regulator
MPVTPTQRLACAIVARPFRERPAIARRAGVGPTAVARAAAGMPVRAEAYLKLCAAIGINSLTGEPAPVRSLGDLHWGLLGLGIEMRRRLGKIGTQRDMVKKIGGRVSLRTISFIENGKHVSIGSVLAICEFIGVAPEQYCGEPKKLHVKRITETSEGAAA